jgi:L-glyceraldehyde 3-phosphate reductase
LTDRYIKGIPSDSRVMTDGRFLKENDITEEKLRKVRLLNEIALKKGMTLAEMSLAWILAKKEVTSVIIGASKSSQILDNIKAINAPAFTEEELKQIDSIALD